MTQGADRPPPPPPRMAAGVGGGRGKEVTGASGLSPGPPSVPPVKQK